jgi:hypothetical protein
VKGQEEEYIPSPQTASKDEAINFIFINSQHEYRD